MRVTWLYWDFARDPVTIGIILGSILMSHLIFKLHIACSRLFLYFLYAISPILVLFLSLLGAGCNWYASWVLRFGLPCLRDFRMPPNLMITYLRPFILKFMYERGWIYSDAIEGFQWFLQEKREPSSVSLTKVFPACIGLVVLKLKNELHGHVLNDIYGGGRYEGDIIMNGYACVHHRL